ncbi:MAG: magnesium transporter, partial [Chlamydiota bacterium]
MDKVEVKNSQPDSKENGFLFENRARLDDILQEKLEKVFHKQTSAVSLHDIAKIAFEHSPEDLAFAVSHLPPTARPVLYDNLPSREAKVSFVIHTDTDTRLAIFRYMSDQEMKKLFDKMPTEEAVSVLEDMSERR